MARDYKNRAGARKKAKPAAPMWIWLLTGFILGAFTVGLAWIKSSDMPESGWIGNKPAIDSTPSSVTDEEDETAAVNPPQFDFYNLLPEMEVVIPEEELNTQPLSQREEKLKQKNLSYLLQVGSFRSNQDADKLKATLALLGHQAKVHKSQSGKQTWHRVRIGPFKSSKSLKNTQRQLAQNGHDTLVIKIK